MSVNVLPPLAFPDQVDRRERHAILFRGAGAPRVRLRGAANCSRRAVRSSGPPVCPPDSQDLSAPSWRGLKMLAFKPLGVGGGSNPNLRSN